MPKYLAECTKTFEEDYESFNGFSHKRTVREPIRELCESKMQLNKILRKWNDPPMSDNAQYSDIHIYELKEIHV